MPPNLKNSRWSSTFWDFLSSRQEGYVTVLPASCLSSIVSSSLLYCVLPPTRQELALKKIILDLKIPFMAVVPALFMFELITSTQIRILLATYPSTDIVLSISIATAFWELFVRIASLFKLRWDGKWYEDNGWKEEHRQRFASMEWIFVAVSSF